jgi:hypothetical protein
MVVLNQLNLLLETSILRTTCQTKSSRNVHTDLTEVEATEEVAGMAEAAVMVAVEVEATEEVAAIAVAVATEEAAEEVTVAAEAAVATNIKR